MGEGVCGGYGEDMKIDLWVSPGNGNVEGEILFYLVSGDKKQAFKGTWTVINRGGYREGKPEDMKRECLNCLIEIRLKELMRYLNKQLEQGVFNPSGTMLLPLDRGWRIE